MKQQYHGHWGIALVLLSLYICAANVYAQENGELYRWDIASLQPPILRPGGSASAAAANGWKIIFTGSGTFRIDQPPRIEGPRIGSGVTGGGTWAVQDPQGNVTPCGTYDVVEVISFRLAPGTALGTVTQDLIGAREDQRAGVAVLRVLFSDGGRGILILSSRLGGTPDFVVEGISATDDFINYFNVSPVVGSVDANHISFHILRNKNQ
ncbi:MAG: hypothetical protein HY644_15400 [Acidobacteria bacterium]|nr:hypothetical protein [Acidobacteriota bacterium]